QQILAHETGVTRTVDPLGGSWFVESLTDRVEAEALDLIGEIDNMGRGPWKPEHATTSSLDEGGAVRGIHRGYFRRQIAEASYRFSEECEAGDRIIVGLNEYNDAEEDRPIDILQIGPEVETQQLDRLGEFKSRRDADGVKRALDTIRESARAGDNVMQSLVDGALANCTLGEMVQAMADIYGRYTGGPEW
ncbi:MAG: methylmalonyl-CoA mutase family protein, partial [Planctomycetota bacterium]